MNAKQLIAAVTVFAAAGSAFADVTGTFTDYVNVPSSKTRAEVMAELQQARSDGTLAEIGGVEFAGQSTFYAGAPTQHSNNATAATSGKTRAEVLAELKQARADGTYVIGGQEFSEPVMAVNSGRSRADVRQEASASRSGNKVSTQESGS